MDCPGCTDPRDFDNISWVSMPQEEFDTTLQRLGTCASCRAELESARKQSKELSSDNFMTDFENACLSKWDSSKRPHPRGPQRHEDIEWAALIRSQMNYSDVDFQKYVEFVQNGGGDEWFQEEGTHSDESL